MVNENLSHPRTEPVPTGSWRPGRWISDWSSDDESFWDAGGRRTARRNLALSMFAEHIGFSIWVVWTVVVLNLADAGIHLPVSDLFVLTMVPNVVGALLRVPYTFAVPRFGGRLWTTVSAALLLVPAVLLAAVVPSGWLAAQHHATQLWVLILCAATAGLGGGNFASSMANISFFYPERRKGWALGLNAAGGNLGVAVAQVAVPLAVIIGVPAAAVRRPLHQVHLAYAGLVWLPLIVLAAVGAWLFMDSLTQARTDTDAYRAALRSPHTWVISVLYVGTFGSFIGFSFAMPLVIKNTFPAFLAGHPFIATYLAGLGFLGALVGSLSRPLGGWLADRFGGARVTVTAFLTMAVATGAAISAIERLSFGGFLGAYLLLFLVTGAGNGSTYKMIPAVFRPPAGSATPAETAGFKRQAAAVLGIAGAVGALGGALIQLALRQSSLQVSHLVQVAATPAERAAVASAHAAWSVPALAVFLGSYLVLAGVAWAVYGRRTAEAGASTPALPGEPAGLPEAAL